MDDLESLHNRIGILEAENANLEERVINQRAALAKLQRKYDGIKGQYLKEKSGQAEPARLLAMERIREKFGAITKLKDIQIAELKEQIESLRKRMAEQRGELFAEKE